jgi:hypothetical protein
MSYLLLRATNPAHFTLINPNILVTFDEEYEQFSSHSMQFPPAPRTIFFLGANICLSSLFSVRINLCPSPTARDQVTHAQKHNPVLQMCLLLPSGCNIV